MPLVSLGTATASCKKGRRAVVWGWGLGLREGCRAEALLVLLLRLGAFGSVWKSFFFLLSDHAEMLQLAPKNWESSEGKMLLL